MEALIAQTQTLLTCATPTQKRRLQASLDSDGHLDLTGARALGEPLRHLAPAHIDALLRIDRTPGQPEPRSASMLDRSLADPLLLTGSGPTPEGWAINPIRFCQYLQALPHRTTARWAWEHAHTDSVLAARIWLGLRANTDPCWTTWPRADGSWMHICADFYRRLPDSPDLGAIQQAAGRLRRALLLELERPADAVSDLVARLFDVPVPTNAPAWQATTVLSLMMDDARLLRWAMTPAEFPVDSDLLLTWWARVAVGDIQNIDWADVPTLNDARPDALVMVPLPRSVTLPAPDVMRAVIDRGWAGRAPDSTTRELLVDGLLPCLEAVPWTRALQLTNRPDLTNALRGLLDEDEDWGDFDAAGDGCLPGIWARVARLVGPLDAELMDALQHADDELADLLSEMSSVDGGWFASPMRSGEHLAQSDRNPMSSYAHGLHDAVGEAYGDVYSRADPFSVREPAEPADE